jgi:pimeloyl-ACP methyl ester carboxylesterase
MNRRPGIALALLLVAPGLAAAQANRDAIVILKDGFVAKGRVLQKQDVIYDPTGAMFRIPAAGSFLYLDDHVRRMHFTPGQIQEVIPLKPGDKKEQMQFKKATPSRSGSPILFSGEYESISDWNTKWERVIKARAANGMLNIRQRIALLTPHQIQGYTITYNWTFSYLTKEWGPDMIRSLLVKHFSEKKEMKEPEKRKQIAMFLEQAGWYFHAEKELNDLVKEFPDQKEKVKDHLEQIRRAQAGEFVEELDRAQKAGLHDEVRARLATYARLDLGKLVEAKNALAVEDLKTRYDGLDDRLKRAKKSLTELADLATDKPLWTAAAKTILEELNLDTVGRLDTFLDFAKQHLDDLAQKRKPSQTTDEVFAIAISGWLQGNIAADPDPKTAEKLWQARTFLLEYLRSDSSVARGQMRKSFEEKVGLPHDVLARMLRLLPPSHPYDGKIGTEPLKLTVEVPDGEATTYQCVLPPGYHPYRPYPVVVLLHSGRETPADMLPRWVGYAAKYGFIVVAPRWGEGLKPTYNYSAQEHAAVLDTLRDVRRRFNVDSDRVHLFGWEDGATAAFDIATAHPDQFAGVAPMNGSVKGFTERCWSNAQYLPFYVVEGDRNGHNPGQFREMFKDWVKGNYPSVYVEYKGRASEWYFAEVPEIINWMSRKKRAHPSKDLGRYHTGGGIGEEFKTMRDGLNRFYFLGTDDVNPKNQNDPNNWNKYTMPATLQANIGVSNESDIKTGAYITTHVMIRTRGVKHVTLWITPTMIDFTKPVQVRVNGQSVGRPRVIHPSLETMLEEIYVSGDRQRIVLAKMDIKL